MINVRNGKMAMQYDPRVVQTIPHAQVITRKGNHYLVLPHKPEESKLLQNLGYEVPAPILSNYDWAGTQPYNHQKVTAALMTQHRRGYVLNGLGCIDGEAEVLVQRNGASRRMKLVDLHEKFHRLGGEWRCRSLMGDRFGQNEIRDVLFQGHKSVLRITLANGKTLRCTEDHEIAQPDGKWCEAGQLVSGSPVLTNGIMHYQCPDCGAERSFKGGPGGLDKHWGPYTRRCRACAMPDRVANTKYRHGEDNPSWKGGRYIDCDGYVHVLQKDHPNTHGKGYVLEHRLVMEHHLNRILEPEEVVHHINGNKSDNRLENLELCTDQGEHNSHHDQYKNLHGGSTVNGGKVWVTPEETTVVSVTADGTAGVYDLVMADPHRNFVADGVVVHNSGKTRAALYAFDYLRSIGEATRMLVVAPLSTLTPTWESEVFGSFPHLTTAVLHGTKDKRLKTLYEPADIYVINHDGVHILADQLRDRRDLNFVIVDELTAFKNAKSRRWKSMNQVAQMKKWVWGMTGSPTPLAPTDAFGQVKLITPNSGPRFFKAFREETMYQLTQFRWMPRDNANDRVFEFMQPSVRFSTEECIDLPPMTIIDRLVPLSTQQKKVYKRLKDDFYAAWEAGEVDAANAGVRMSKLLQVCGGWVYNSEGKALHLQNDDRIEEVRSIIDQAEGKVIVFAPYRHAVDEITALMRFYYGNDAVERIYGGTPKSERDRIFALFKDSNNPRVLVAHPKSMSHGLSLVAANTIVWFSPPDSLETFEQANARITRPGQTRHQNIVCIRGAPIEKVVYNRLKERGKVQDALLYMFESQKGV